MCGITGCIVNGNPELASNIYFKLLQESDIRGQDGTGVTLLRNGKLNTMRWDCRAKEIPAETFPKLLANDKIIGQNRYAIFGLDTKNNQPLKGGNFALVHNGVLYNYEEKFKELCLERKLKVDTELILRLFQVHYDPQLPQMKVNQIMNMFEGEAACLVLFNTPSVSYHSFIAFMKNKILCSAEDSSGNLYYFSTERILKKLKEYQFYNIKSFKNNECLILR